MKKPRRIRITCFPLGSIQNDASPVKHHACKTRERADAIYAKYQKKVGTEIGRVVMHEGNLRRHSFKIIQSHPAAPLYVDTLTAKHTAFSCFRDLIEAKGGYFPSLNVANPERLLIADTYDVCQAKLGDPRRICRWGVAA